jgi:hypothetical protein
MTASDITGHPTADRLQRWLEIGFLVLVAVLTFGIFVHRFGLYFDDWVTVYILERLSFWHLLDLAQGQSRPMHAVLMALVGTDPLVSHAATFGVLVANMLLIRGLLRLIWPHIGVLATVIAALYAVYPGYWFRPVSIALVTESSLTMALVSWLLAVYSVRWHGWRRYLAAAVSMLLIPLYVLTYELPVGVEALRPLLFWALIPALTQRERLRRALIHWWPWGLTLAAVIVYRLVIFEPYGLYVGFNVVEELDIAAASQLFLNVFSMQLSDVWFNPINSAAFQDLTAGLIGMVLAAAALALMFYKPLPLVTTPRIRSLAAMLLIGLCILVLGQATQIVSLKPPSPVGWSSRWNQVSMLGAVLIWCSAILLIGRIALRKYAAVLVVPTLVLLIAAGGAVHVRIGNHWADDWYRVRSLWWQLAHTAPDIADNTTILFDFPDASLLGQPEFFPFAYEGLAAADLFFNNPTLAAMNYVAQEEVGLIARNEANLPIQYTVSHDEWALNWHLDPQRRVLVRLVDGCLQVVDPAYLERYDLRPRVQRLASPLAPDPQQFFVDVLEGKTFPYRHLFDSPISAEGCPSPFAIPGD